MNEKKNFDYKKLHPFKWYILENFPFLEDSIDVLTNYQLFCKLGEMYNKEVDAINTLGIQVEGLTDWFDNLDVQDEINNKLDEMVEDGTFQEILEPLVDDRLEEKVNKIVPNSLLDGKYYINVTYSNDDTSQKYLNFSRNGYEWIKVCDIPKEAFIADSAYDIHTKIINNEFVMIYDVLDQDFNGWRDLEYWAGGNRIAISKTSDFVTWEKYYLDIDLQYKQTFSPCFFLYNNKVYFTVSLSDCSKTYTETLSGNTSYKKDTYLCELNNTLNEIVNTDLILESELCTIDSQLYENGGSFYLFVKNENDDTIMQFKSSNFMSFSTKINELKYHLLTTTNYTAMEGPSIVKIGNLYYLFADLNGVQKTCVYISNNIETWYNHNLVYSDDRMVNFGVEEIDSTKKPVMNLLFEQYNYPENRKPLKSKYNASNDCEYLTYESDETNFSKFYVLPNKTYTGFVNSYTITLDLDLIAPGETFRFISKQGSNKTITLDKTNIHGESIDTILSYSESRTFVRYVDGSLLCSPVSNYSPIKRISGKLTFSNVNANTYGTQTISVPGITYGNCQAILLTPIHGIGNVSRTIYTVVSSISANTVEIGMRPSMDIGAQEVYYEIIYKPIA